MFAMGNRYILEGVRNIIGNSRKFSEDRFFDIRDYDMRINTGAILGGKTNVDIGIGSKSEIVSGTWGNDGFIVLIAKDSEVTEGVADEIERSIKAGGLALCDGRSGLFRNRGLSLVFVNAMFDG